MFHKILIANDGSEGAGRALSAAIKLAKLLDAELHMISVEEGVDLLVLGYMGHSSLYNRLIGSMTERLVEHAPCAVLVVK